MTSNESEQRNLSESSSQDSLHQNEDNSKAIDSSVKEKNLQEDPNAADLIPVEFKAFIKKYGLYDVIKNILLKLFMEPDKPMNGVEYVRNFLDKSITEIENRAKDEIDELNEQKAALEKSNKALEESNEILMKMIETLLNLGLKEKDVQVEEFSEDEDSDENDGE